MIDNPEVVKFTNEYIRPTAERLRALRYELDALLTAYANGPGDIIYANTSETIDDGRVDEGVSALTCNDVMGVIAVITSIQDVLKIQSNINAVAKPCVRPFRIE